jgi:predicted RNase H-like nuclease (RuvC/YqgF family)
VAATQKALVQKQVQLQEERKRTRAEYKLAQSYKEEAAQYQQQLDALQRAAADKEEGLRQLERQLMQLLTAASPMQTHGGYPMEQLWAVQEATEGAASELEQGEAEMDATHAAWCQEQLDNCEADEAVAAEQVAVSGDLQQEDASLTAPLARAPAYKQVCAALLRGAAALQGGNQPSSQ